MLQGMTCAGAHTGRGVHAGGRGCNHTLSTLRGLTCRVGGRLGAVKREGGERKDMCWTLETTGAATPKPPKDLAVAAGPALLPAGIYRTAQPF